jgi:outer membrane protein assembly factor BamB
VALIVKVILDVKEPGKLTMSDMKNDDLAAGVVSAGISNSPKSVRIWPAVAILLGMVCLRNLPSAVTELSPIYSMLSAMLPAALSILLILWWLLFSRVAWRERFIGLAIVLVVGIIAALVIDSTMVGLGMIVYLLPYGIGVFAFALIIAGGWQSKSRLIAALIGAIIGFGFSDMIRTDGMTGDFRISWLWRWELNGEERVKARMEKRGSVATQSALVDEPISEIEWSGFRGPNRNGVGPDIELDDDWNANAPREIWRIPVGPSWSSFSVAGRRIFTQEQRGDNEAVVCYNAETGDEIWIREYESRFWEAIGGVGPRATPTINGSELYTMGSEGVVLKLNAVTGQIVWRRDLQQEAGRKPPEWGFSSSPLVVGSTVVVHAGAKGDKGTLAFDTDSGEPKWSAPAGDHSYSSPQLATLGGKQGVLMVTNDGVRMHDSESGEQLWEYAWKSEGYRSLQPLVLSDTSLLITTGMNTGTRRIDLKLEGDSFVGEERWTSKGIKTDYNDYVAHEGFLYGFDGSIFACIDLETGDKRWKRGRYGNGQVLLLPKAGQLLVVTEEGAIVLLNANSEKHEEVARIQAVNGKTWNHPVMVGNRLYVRNGEEAVCFEMAVK